MIEPAVLVRLIQYWPQKKLELNLRGLTRISMFKSSIQTFTNYLLRKVDASDNKLFYYKKLRAGRNLVQRNHVKAKSYAKFLKRNKPPVKNVYHASVQKTASQWIKSIFSDSRVRRRTGLDVYPSHRYEFGEFHHKFPPYTFVPGLYIPYLLYREIVKPDNYATFYVIRDPRDVVVSWYHSMLNSHRLVNKQVQAHRETLKDLNKEEGINYCIRAYHMKLSFMRSWAYFGKDDDSVLIVKFEDLTTSPVDVFKRIFDHSRLSMSKEFLEEILKDYTKEKMRERDKNRRADVSSNYSKGGSDWQQDFSKNNREFFNKINGDLVELLGYD